MKKFANVIEVLDGGNAKISLFKHSKCSGCGACNKSLHPGSLVLASNPIKAKVNDRVAVDVKKNINILEIFIMYILPTLLFFLGLWLGYLLVPYGAPDFLGLIFAAGFFVLSLVLYFNTRHLYPPIYKNKIYKNLSTK